jgi:hypothetical protein
MDKLEVAKGLGEAIVRAQHESFVSEKSEDLYHITNLKRIIVAISEYLKSEGLQVESIKGVTDDLKGLSRSLYLESCLSNKDDDEDEETVREESVLWFDYTYEHEEYPR